MKIVDEENFVLAIWDGEVFCNAIYEEKLQLTRLSLLGSILFL